MKLKKIASLALAGVMAVSTLTACNGANGNSGQPSEEDNSTVTGYSAMLAKYMEDVAEKDHVTFQDNATDASALKDALGNFGTVTIGGGSLLPYVVCLDSPNIFGLINGNNTGITNMAKDLSDALDFKDGSDLQPSDLSFSSIVNENMNATQKDGTVFAVDGSIDLEKAMNQIANGNSNGYIGLNSYMNTPTALPESGTEGGITCDYHYTVSVSVVNKPLTVVDGYSGSVNFIAVTVTRTGTAA